MKNTSSCGSNQNAVSAAPRKSGQIEQQINDLNAEVTVLSEALNTHADRLVPVTCSPCPTEAGKPSPEPPLCPHAHAIRELVNRLRALRHGLEDLTNRVEA
jgi:hypothetical protein